MNKFVQIAVVGTELLVGMISHASEIGNNLTNSWGYDALAYAFPGALVQRFIIGDGVSYTLDSVTVPLNYNGGGSNSVIASLWDANPEWSHDSNWASWLAPAPGNQIAVLGTAPVFFSNPTSFRQTFSSLTPIILNPGQTYWLALSLGQENPNSIGWGSDNAHTDIFYQFSGVAGIQGSANGNYQGAGIWYGPSPIVRGMSIEGTAVVPEPSTTALGFLGFFSVATFLRRLHPKRDA